MRRARRATAFAVLALLALAGCNPPWKAATVIEGLRVMGVRASPPEVQPGQPAALEVLLADPSRPGQQSTTIWLGCEPDPFDQGRSACSSTALLTDPSALFGTGALPPGMKVIGLNEQAAYASSPTLFDVLPAGDTRRTEGVVGQVLAVAVAEEVPIDATREQLAEVFARVQDKSLPSLITLFRVRVSESQNPNRNPTFDSFSLDAVAHPDGGTVLVRPGQQVTVLIGAPPDSFEPYQQTEPSGVVDKVERINVAWFSTSGSFSEDRIALGSTVPEVFTAPGGEDTNDPVPDSRTGTLWAVGRDSRGGVTWASFPFFVCDDTLPAPKVTRVLSPSSPGEPLVLEGEHLESLLDVVVGGVACRDGAYSSSRGTWQGTLGQLPAGVYPVTVSGRDCTTADTGLTAQVP